MIISLFFVLPVANCNFCSSFCCRVWSIPTIVGRFRVYSRVVTVAIHELKQLAIPLNVTNLQLHYYFLISWLYGPQTALASLITGAHSSLSTAFWRHLLTLNSRWFSFTSSSHHNQGLPLLLLPPCLLSNIFLTFLTWSILTTCPTHSNLFFLISTTTSRSLTASVV